MPRQDLYEEVSWQDLFQGPRSNISTGLHAMSLRKLSD